MVKIRRSVIGKRKERLAPRNKGTIEQKGGQKPPVHKSLQSSGFLQQSHPVAVRSFFVLGGSGSNVDGVVEELLSLPLMVKDAIASGMHLQFSDALPAISFPFAGTISAKILLNAIARVLCLAVSFKTSFVGREVFHDERREGALPPH
jgi:hypothetical protein